MPTKNTRKPIDAVPFKTPSGHELQPGDAAIAVTCSTRQADLRHGRYLGQRKSQYYGGAGVSVVMEVVKSRSVLRNKETGEAYDHALELKELPYPKYPYGISYHSVEYRPAQEKYRNEYAVRKAAINERQKDYAWVKEEYLGTTALQLNKIYPADIALRDVVRL